MSFEHHVVVQMIESIDAIESLLDNWQLLYDEDTEDEHIQWRLSVMSSAEAFCWHARQELKTLHDAL
jgi:hypothetical protein